jgi:uncharacterized protein YjiS (DUF1127 family)
MNLWSKEMHRYAILPRELFRRWRHCRNIHRELSQFNDRDLLDLGIRRSDIGHVACAAAELLREFSNNS